MPVTSKELLIELLENHKELFQKEKYSTLYKIVIRDYNALTVPTLTLALKSAGVDVLKKLDKVPNHFNRDDEELKSIEIPSNIKEVGVCSFFNCKNLEDVKFNEGLQTIRLEAFRASGIKELHLPSTCEDIGIQAFQGCSNLEVVDLNSVKVIGEACFFKCTNIKQIVLPKTLTRIGENAFSGCKCELIYDGTEEEFKQNVTNAEYFSEAGIKFKN